MLVQDVRALTEAPVVMLVLRSVGARSNPLGPYDIAYRRGEGSRGKTTPSTTFNDTESCSRMCERLPRRPAGGKKHHPVRPFLPSNVCSCQLTQKGES